MRSYKKVSKIEEINGLKDTLKRNEDALDYIQNVIYRTENLYKLDENDKEVEATLHTEQYIKFSLEYLDKCYTDRLKQLGVRL